MLSTIRKRFTYTNIALTLALVFAMSGGAYAAGKYLITSTKQISPKVLSQLKGKTGKAGAPGIAGAKGEAGAVGKEGAQGKEGKTGPEGKEGKEGSPWSNGGTLPSGKTETGTWAFVADGEGEIRVPLSFPIPTSQALEPTLGRGPVEFAQPGEEDPLDGHPDCEGSLAKPEADPGFVCVYAAAKLEKAAIRAPGPVRTSGVVLVFESQSSARPGPTDEGTWAVTAP